MLRCREMIEGEDPEAGVETCMALAEQGDAAAQYDIGLLFVSGENMLIDYKAAKDWFSKAAEQGLPDAIASLGGIYYHGIGVEQDVAEGIRLFEIAAERGSTRAQLALGLAYYNGRGVTQDQKKGEALIRGAAATGLEDAQDTVRRLFGQHRDELLGPGDLPSDRNQATPREST